MKKGLLITCSILLILTCFFGLLSCLAGMGDVANIQEYKLADSEEAKAGLEQAREGIAQLEENELTYVDGVKAYEEGAAQLKELEEQLQLGQAQLAQGEAGVAMGQSQLDANYSAYVEGKEQLEKVEPYMQYVDAYVNFRDKNLEGIRGFDNVQEWCIDKVRPVAADNGFDIPEDCDDLSGYVQGMVTDGEAALQMYEDGQAQVNSGKAQLASGYAQLEEGKAAYEDGKKQLLEGDAKLKEYEDGQAQLIDGMNQLLDGMTASKRRSGEQTVPSLKEMLGEDWSLYKLDENGKKVQYRDCDFVDLDACEKLCNTAEDYMALSEADVTAELGARVVTYIVASVACLCGLIAGIRGIIAAAKRRTKTGSVMGIICAAFAVLTNVIGAATGYTNYIYGTRNADKVISYSGSGQFRSLVLLAIVAIAFAIVSIFAKKKTIKYLKVRQRIENI